MRPHRIGALVARYLYLYKRSIPRLMEIAYWPLLDLLLWGFITLYLKQSNITLPHVAGFFLGALILWDVLYRSQQGISLSFLEELWSRNLLNLFVTPLSPGEFLVSTMVIAVLKILSASFLTSLLAWTLYSFNIFLLGVSLIPFVINLVVMGWSIGILTTALILLYGPEADVLAWGLAFFFQPVSAVFYPMDVLPRFLQAIARWIPAAHVFEGMRKVLSSGTFPIHELLWASGLNLVYLFCSILLFHQVFAIVKERGLLMRIGDE